MDRCQQEGCRGHFGKFSSCLAEALYGVSLEGFATDTTGSVEAYGHVSLFEYDKPTTLDLDGLAVTVPAGGHVLTESERGFVSLMSDTLDVARAAFAAEEDAYGQWLEEIQPV